MQVRSPPPVQPVEAVGEVLRVTPDAKKQTTDKRKGGGKRRKRAKTTSTTGQHIDEYA